MVYTVFIPNDPEFLGLLWFLVCPGVGRGRSRKDNNGMKRRPRHMCAAGRQKEQRATRRISDIRPLRRPLKNRGGEEDVITSSGVRLTQKEGGNFVKKRKGEGGRGRRGSKVKSW